ncbi:hypothetical protein [Streptomyces sp. NPDC000395]|uniref:hypothetical protein n=1 Tax=Streptomyces sp. NPDC000395 TaxID=3154252 RepID=UPI00336A9B75
MIFQAGDSGEGRDFAARNADVIFSAHGNDFDDALAFADDIRRRLRAVGRPQRRRRAAAEGGSGRHRERRLLRRPAHHRSARGRGRMAGEAEAHGWSLRETAIALGPQRGHVGTPSRNCRNAGSTAPSTPAPPCARTSACAHPSRTGPRRTDGRRAEHRDGPSTQD